MKHTFNACPKSNVQMFSQLDKRNIYSGLNAHPDCVNQEAVKLLLLLLRRAIIRSGNNFYNRARARARARVMSMGIHVLHTC